MITAKEARALYDKSGAEIQDYLTHNIEKQIIGCSEGGKKYYIHYLGAEQWTCPNPSRLIQGVIDELKRLGYVIQYGFYGEKYVPCTLAGDDDDDDDDNDDGSMYQNYGITIGW